MKVAGVVPAAGASRRMGTAKGLLMVDGDTFIRRVVCALVDGGCAPVYAVVPGTAPAISGERANPDHEAIADEARAAGAVVLRNPDPGEGPITSLRIALEALPDDVDAVAYLPLDHPLVTSDVVRQLRAAVAERGAPLALPVHRGKRGHPSVFGRAIFAELLDPALEGGARTVVHRHLDRAYLLDVDDPGTVMDIDTPDAYRKALALREADETP